MATSDGLTGRLDRSEIPAPTSGAPSLTRSSTDSVANLETSQGDGQGYGEAPPTPRRVVRYLPQCASPKPYGAPPSVIESFDRAKAIYIFLLVGFHQRFLRTTSPEHSIYISDHLSYTTVDHGVELMMGLLLISGWLSSATWKDLTWGAHMRKKVSRLIPPYIVAVAITLPAVVVQGTDWWHAMQYTLELLTLGGWNPALQWQSFNRPLWFISTLLSYHYASPFFLPWIRKRSVRQLGGLFVCFYLLRQCIGLATLLALREIFGEEELPQHVRVIHLWSPTQVWVPVMGALLHQLATRTSIPNWLTHRVAWVLTDMLMLIVIGLTCFIPATGSTILDAMIAYMNLVTGPFITALVVLMSVDAGSLWYVTTRTEEARKLFGTLLSSSYPLYLLHWPLIELMGKVGLFEADSWDSVLGAWLCSVMLSAIIDTVAVGPFTRLFVKKVMPPSDKSLKSLRPRLRRANNMQDVSAIMEEATMNDTTSLFARIIALERSLYLHVNGGSAHDVPHCGSDLFEEELKRDAVGIISSAKASEFNPLGPPEFCTNDSHRSTKSI